MCHIELKNCTIIVKLLSPIQKLRTFLAFFFSGGCDGSDLTAVVDELILAGECGAEEYSTGAPFSSAIGRGDSKHQKYFYCMRGKFAGFQE